MDNKKILISTLKAWLPLAAVIIIFSCLAYILVQQNYRLNANDPQIEIAEEVVEAISQGVPAASIAAQTKSTDIKTSLSPFILVFDDSKKVIGSSAILDGKTPEVPEALLESAKSGQNRSIWEPQAGVRIAAVINRYSGEQNGYVLVGKSLREIQKRESAANKTIAIAGGAALILTLLIIFIFKKFFRSEHHGHHEHPPTEPIKIA